MTRRIIPLLLFLSIYWLPIPCYAGWPPSSIQVAEKATLAPHVLPSIQSQFHGRIVGIRPLTGNRQEIQILTEKNRMILVTVDSSSGAILNVQQ